MSDNHAYHWAQFLIMGCIMYESGDGGGSAEHQGDVCNLLEVMHFLIF